MPNNWKYPGVYIQEQASFQKAVVGVPTAVAAFIGYTPQASYRGVSYQMKPFKISSFEAFKMIFGFPRSAVPFAPQYYLEEYEPVSNYRNPLDIAASQYALLPDPNTIYYLYQSVRCFFQNGGQTAYIVSVGSYGTPSGKSMGQAERLINTNVHLDDLLAGLKTLKKEEEPTMYICPEATLLSSSDNASLMQAMLQQNEEMKTAVSIFDIIGARNPDPNDYLKDITRFRENTGSNGLSHGIAYYPFLQSTLISAENINYTQLFGGDLRALAKILGIQTGDITPLARLIKEIQNAEADPSRISRYNQALINTSPDYRKIMDRLKKEVNLLPSSGAMAGIFAQVDQNRGVWKAPANVSILGAADVSIRLTNAQQEPLNIDPLAGKSINAIRFFPGRGILVWGARTLAGNDNEWRYVPVRRTIIYIEQSLKKALESFVFEPNDQNTWTQVKAMLENFLEQLWKQGGLVGSKASDAYYVLCGQGTTMTAADVAAGRLIVTFGVALFRPVEFSVVQIQQMIGKA